MSGDGPLTLEFGAEGVRARVRLAVDSAPLTIAALLDTLPARVDLHCAKVAGDQIIWAVPVVMPFEAPRDILSAPAGTLIYYPRRQFLELMLGPMQEESASATVLGTVEGDPAPLLALCERLQAAHGTRVLWAEIGVSGARDALNRAVGTAVAPRGLHPPVSDAEASGALRDARAFRRRIWAQPPDELSALAGRRGTMMPLGALVWAESETRKLHEFLWAIRETGDAPLAARAASVLLQSSAVQLRDFLGLDEIAGAMDRVADALAAGGRNTWALLDEAIMAVGRTSHWIDLLFPWQRLNAAMAQQGSS